jgi:hypothetical protein
VDALFPFSFALSGFQKDGSVASKVFFCPLPSRLRHVKFFKGFFLADEENIRLLGKL